MKKLITLLMCAIMLASAVIPVGAFISEAETAPSVGDANGDGKVDLKDSSIIKSALLGRDTSYFIAGADTTGDGVVNSKDAFMLKQYLADDSVQLAPGDGYTVERIVLGNTEIADFEISLPADATENMEFAASELQEYIMRARGAKLDIVYDSTAEHRIVIALDTTGELGNEGVDILCKDGNLYITGGQLRGCMYAVYDFLERYIGWVFINDENVCLNKNGSIIVKDGSHYHHVPAMEFRDSMTHSYEGSHLPAVTKLKISSWRGRGALEKSAKYGYSIGFVGTAHTMADYCSDIDNDHQICYNTASRFNEVLKGVLAKIEDVLSRGYPCPSISVSPMDNTNYCSCTKCRAGYSQAQSYMGPQLDFVNRIAAEVEKVYPEVHVLTLAYWLARIPPKNGLVPADNVDILFCWCGCNNHPYTAELCSEDGDRWWYTNVYDRQYFETWRSITKGKLYAWHYSTSYQFYLGQPDIIDNILADIKYMSDVGVDGIYCEGYYGSHEDHKDGNTFDLLTMYLLARCIWDPDMSKDEYNAYLEEYMYWYYGDGWKELVEYRKMCGEATEALGKCWVNNGDMVFDCISEQYYADNNDKVFELIDTALEKTLAGGSDEQYDRLVHLAAGAYWLCLASTYESKYTNGTEAERTLYEERYTRLFNWMLDYSIVDLDGKREGFDNATYVTETDENGAAVRVHRLDFNTDPYLWTGLTIKNDTKKDKPKYR